MSATPAAEPTHTDLASTQPNPVAADVLGQGAPWAQLERWWAGLTMGRRRQLLTLTAAETLPLTLAADLHRRGVWCPLVLVNDGSRLVRRAVPSPVLLQFLAAQAA